MQAHSSDRRGEARRPSARRFPYCCPVSGRPLVYPRRPGSSGHPPASQAAGARSPLACFASSPRASPPHTPRRGRGVLAAILRPRSSDMGPGLLSAALFVGNALLFADHSRSERSRRGPSWDPAGGHAVEARAEGPPGPGEGKVGCKGQYLRTVPLGLFPTCRAGTWVPSFLFRLS